MTSIVQNKNPWSGSVKVCGGQSRKFSLFFSAREETAKPTEEIQTSRSKHPQGDIQTLPEKLNDLILNCGVIFVHALKKKNKLSTHLHFNLNSIMILNKCFVSLKLSAYVLALHKPARRNRKSVVRELGSSRH